MTRVTLNSNRLAAMFAEELAIARSGDTSHNTRQYAVRNTVISVADLIIQEHNNDPQRLRNSDFSKPRFYVLCGLAPNGDLRC